MGWLELATSYSETCVVQIRISDCKIWNGNGNCCHPSPTFSVDMNSCFVETNPDTSILFSVGMTMNTTSVTSFFEPYKIRSTANTSHTTHSDAVIIKVRIFTCNEQTVCTHTTYSTPWYNGYIQEYPISENIGE